jgi:hypothetical protein
LNYNTTFDIKKIGINRIIKGYWHKKKDVRLWIMSLEIRPLAALYHPPPPTKNVLFNAAISSFALDLCS